MSSLVLSLCTLIIAVGTSTARTVATSGCFNEHECCDVWATGGHCGLNSRMTRSCRAACGSCRPNYNKQACDDYHYGCLERVRRGECQSNPDWMAENCRKSCRLCNHLKCGVAPARSTVIGEMRVHSDPIMAQTNCNEGWQYHNGFCYRGFMDEKTWDEARTSCSRLALDAHLVAIESKEENEFVFENIVKGKASVQGWWIGIKRDGQDSDTFVTSTDQNREISYDNFARAEPNNGLVREGCLDYWFEYENCVEIYSADHKKGHWNDAKCRNRKPYICKQHERGSRKAKRS